MNKEYKRQKSKRAEHKANSLKKLEEGKGACYYTGSKRDLLWCPRSRQVVVRSIFDEKRLAHNEKRKEAKAEEVAKLKKAKKGKCKVCEKITTNKISGEGFYCPGEHEEQKRESMRSYTKKSKIKRQDKASEQALNYYKRNQMSLKSLLNLIKYKKDKALILLILSAYYACPIKRLMEPIFKRMLWQILSNILKFDFITEYDYSKSHRLKLNKEMDFFSIRYNIGIETKSAFYGHDSQKMLDQQLEAMAAYQAEVEKETGVPALTIGIGPDNKQKGRCGTFKGLIRVLKDIEKKEALGLVNDDFFGLIK